MCYEYWQEQQARTAEEEAKKRTAEMIEKARAGKPAPPAEPATAGKEKETVPA